ncbi:MAG TPA: TIGR04255 family protein [Verrucomicrobiales bacterium]|nr:TIGR04255 family protein [Verrucomicrobiales bacterium]
MAEPCHLTNAPITEAVVDLRVHPYENFEPPRTSPIADYLDVQPITHHEIALDTRQIVDHGRIGSKFTSADERRIVQIRKDGLTFSRLEPYTDWSDVWRSAAEWIQFYLEHRKRVEIRRIALRYINRLALPIKDYEVDVKQFLTAPPEPPPELKYPVASFLSQVKIAGHDNRLQATIHQVLLPVEQSASPGHRIVVLDIDAFVEEVFQITASTEGLEGLLRRFQALRAFKNELFFAFITDQTVAMYK